MICVCYIMSCYDIFLFQYGVFQHSMGCTKKKFCQPWLRPLLNTSLFSQFRENVTSFNFLAKTLSRTMIQLSYVTMFIYITAEMLRIFHFSLRTWPYIWEELPSGPTDSNQNQKVSSSDPTSQALGSGLVMRLLVSEAVPSRNGLPSPPWKSKLHLAHPFRSWKNSAEGGKLKWFFLIPDIY